MASPAQIDANRVNAQSSTGPKTEAGKTASSRNAASHGLAGGVLFISGEDPASFQQLLRELLSEHKPAGSTEHLLVYTMAEQFWFSQRASGLLTEAIERNRQQDNARQVSLMLRYQAAANRAFYKALNELKKLQKNRPAPPVGFVSQTPPKPAQPSLTIRRDHPKVGRNEACPCGSGKKSKRCCLP